MEYILIWFIIVILIVTLNIKTSKKLEKEGKTLTFRKHESSGTDIVDLQVMGAD